MDVERPYPRSPFTAHHPLFQLTSPSPPATPSGLSILAGETEAGAGAAAEAPKA